MPFFFNDAASSAARAAAAGGSEAGEIRTRIELSHHGVTATFVGVLPTEEASRIVEASMIKGEAVRQQI